MARKLSFTVDGVPKGKGRPRFNRQTGAVITPSETRAEEKRLRTIFNLKHPRHQPHLGPVLLRITAVFPVPDGWTVAQKAAAREGKLYHTSVPDADNITKLVSDALNGAAWVDDSQVMGGCIKRYGSPARLDITIEELEHPVLTPAEKLRHKKLHNQRELPLDPYRRKRTR